MQPEKNMYLPIVPAVGAEKSPPRLGLSDEQKKGREDVIRACEQAYAKTREARPKIDPNLKKPSLFSSSKTKETYDRQYYGLRSFDNQLQELGMYLNRKIAMRGITNTRDLAEVAREFSSNCRRFSGALIDFASWVETGEIKASTGMEESLKKTYQAWIGEAKKGLKK